MAFHVLRVNLDSEGVSKWLDDEMYERGLEIVSTSTYYDTGSDVTAAPYLVVVARDIQPQGAVIGTPLHVRPASSEADLAAFDAWVAGADPDEFADA